MLNLAICICTPAALVGHAMIWVTLVNRVHSGAHWRPAVKLFDAFWYCATAGLPALAVFVVAAERGWIDRAALLPLGTVYAYGALCLAALAIGTPRWVSIRLQRPSDRLRTLRVAPLSVRDRLERGGAGDRLTALAARFPGNQILAPVLEEKTIALARLPASLDGLTIVQISDLHLTGQMSLQWYAAIVERVNALEPDLIALTGDLVDKRRCLSWLPDTLGRLNAPLGCYFVLGNHDKRVRDEPRLRAELTAVGLLDLGGRVETVACRDRTVLLAGDERPWFGAAPESNDAASDADLRILLTHTPDLFGWARRHQFDLMLSGHTHGGQIRLPLIGPVLCPSRFGVRYAAGVYHQAPTVLHVNRGLSATRPIRLNCPPEITRLTLVGDR